MKSAFKFRTASRAGCGLATGLLVLAAALGPRDATAQAVAQAAPVGATDAERIKIEEARMQARFPQPVRVGDLVGLPLLDDSHRTLGHVREVIRTKEGRIKLIVAYGGWFGSSWDARLVAVPIEVVAIRGRELASVDMPRSDYAAAPTWHGLGQGTGQGTDAETLPRDTTIRIALGRS
ncbi:MAG: PRC-barrel domain-containing protein [Xanthobacteraceae bacterium]